MAMLLDGQVAGIISQDTQEAKEKKLPNMRVMAMTRRDEVDNTP